MKTREILLILRNPYGTAHDEVRAAQIEAADLIEAHTRDYEQLKDLTVTIWKIFYREEAPDFEPLDSVLGLITQIDNMVTGLERRKGDE